MEVLIKNHSTGRIAGVTDQGQLNVHAETISQQHFISREFGRAFQVWGTSGTLTSGTNTVLHLKNDDPTRLLIISYIRMQQVGSATGGSFGSIANYFEIGYNRTVASGGSAATIANSNRLSGSVSSVTATQGAPTMAGTFVSAERWYPDANAAQQILNKEGSIILGLNDTMEIRHVGTFTDGIAYARATIMLIDR